MSAAGFYGVANIRRIFQKRKFMSDFFFYSAKKIRLLELNHPEIVLVVDDDAVGVEFAGLAGTFP